MDALDHGTEATVDPQRASIALKVLASGSRGNCSVIAYRAPGERRRFALVDAGLSPRRTRRLLGEAGVSLDLIDDIFLTHLDRDHLHDGWRRGLPARTRLRVHQDHQRRAARLGLPIRQMAPIDPEDRGRGSLRVRATMADHDELGVVAFRFECADVALGFATDLGRPFRALAEALRGVDGLAIESNYCPEMQRGSERPAFLKNRIMGGAGHLSNEQCAALTRSIEPRSSVVLLHLSQECNEPHRALRAHADARYRVTVSSQDEATDWVRLLAQDDLVRMRPGARSVAAGAQSTLFG